MRITLCSLLLIVAAYCSFVIYQQESRKCRLKQDLVELSNIRYGLFSVEEWKQVVAEIVTKKIEELDLSGQNRAELRTKLIELLTRMINDLERRYYEERQNSLTGFVQGMVASITGTFDQMKKDIPKIADQFLEFIEDPQNREAIRKYMIEKIGEYADKTFSETDYSAMQRILDTHGFTHRAEAIEGLSSEIVSIRAHVMPYKIALGIVMLFATLGLIFWKRLDRIEYMIYTGLCFVLLATGLLLPMIEIDARITSLSFTLLGEPVSFTDQVLYYKSKSILEIVHLMMTQSRMDLLFVGLLVLVFSVLFPLSKLVMSVVYLYTPGEKPGRLVQFILFRTGKWSMADVMVVAIFMAYIGFTGIIAEQLRQLETIAQTIDILTTNQSSLLTGFYTFTAFALLSLVISHKLQYAYAKQG